MSIEKEYGILESGYGIVNHSAMGKIKVSGKDRTAFLHRMLTNDIQSLKPGQGCYAMLLKGTGHIEAVMDVLIFEDHILLFVEEDYADQTITKLDRFIITDDVVFEDVTTSLGLLFCEKLPTPLNNNGLSSSWHHLNISHNELEIEIIRRDLLKREGYFLLFSRGIEEKLKNYLTNSDTSLQLVSQNAYEILRIEIGVLKYGADMDETILLPETELENVTVSETKGCYPGQEVIAKIDTYGRLNRRVMRFRLTAEKGLPKSNDVVISEDTKIGKVLSASYLPDSNKIVGLALIKNDYATDGKNITIELNEDKLTGTLSSINHLPA